MIGKLKLIFALKPNSIPVRRITSPNQRFAAIPILNPAVRGHHDAHLQLATGSEPQCKRGPAVRDSDSDHVRPCASMSGRARPCNLPCAATSGRARPCPAVRGRARPCPGQFVIGRARPFLANLQTAVRGRARPLKLLGRALFEVDDFKFKTCRIILCIPAS